MVGRWHWEITFAMVQVLPGAYHPKEQLTVHAALNAIQPIWQSLAVGRLRVQIRSPSQRLRDLGATGIDYTGDLGVILIWQVIKFSHVGAGRLEVVAFLDSFLWEL